MTDLARLAIEIESQQAVKAKRDLDQLTAAGGKTESQFSATAGASRALGAALAGVGLVATARAAIQTADAYALLTARLSLVTRGVQDLARVQGEVFALAQETRSGLGETADLYIRLAQASETLGVSQADTLEVTRAIGQALVVSGASGQSAAAALVQLGQGLASGTLRGEELNSVLEQAPRLARAIADGLGVSVGELRKLGEQGALTSQAVFEAVQSQAQRLSDEFARMPNTVGGALQQVGNSLTGLIGDIDSALGVTKNIAGFVSQIARELTVIRGLLPNAGPAAQLAGLEAQRQSLLASIDKGGGITFRERLADVERQLAALRAQAPTVTIQGADFSNRGRGRNYGAGSIDPRELVAAPRIASASDAAAEALRRQAQAVRELVEARQRAADIEASYLGAGQATVARLTASNQALRDEIETMGLSADAINVVEIARTQANRSIAEQNLLMAEAEGESEARLQQLREEVRLLSEREGLLRERQGKIGSSPGDGVGPALATQVSDPLRDRVAKSLEEGLIDGFARGGSIADIFLRELKAEFAKTVLTPIIRPTVDAGSDLITGLINGALQLFGGGGGNSIIPGGAPLPDSLRGSNNYDVPAPSLGQKRAGAMSGGKQVSITYSPTIQIDSRTDRAAVQQDTQKAVAEGQKQMLSQLKAAGVI